jgi:hypothetical protein
VAHDELTAAMVRYQEYVNQTLTSCTQKHNAKVLEPTACSEHFEEIKRLGRAERRPRGPSVGAAGARLTRRPALLFLKGLMSVPSSRRWDRPNRRDGMGRQEARTVRGKPLEGETL